MKPIRTPAPFPSPDDELCEHFGRTMYYGQKLEKEFKLFLLAAEALGKIKINREHFKTVEDFLLQNKRQNLGRLIKILKNANGPAERQPEALLTGALQDRNKLAHSLFANVDPAQITAKEKETLLKELGRIRLSVGNAFLVIREFRTVAKKKSGSRKSRFRKN